MPRRGDSSWAADGPAPSATGHGTDGGRSRAAAGGRPGGAGLGAVPFLVLAAVVLLPGGPAAAESPTEVADELAVDGVYVAPGRTDIDETAVASALDEARALGGLRLVAVAPNDPQPDAEAFARRVQEASDADAAIVFPPDGGFEAHVIDKFADTHLRAVSAARASTTPVAAVETFSSELLREPEREFPPIIRRLVLVVLLLAVVLVATVAGEQYLRRNGPGGASSLGRGLLATVRAASRRP